MADSSHQPSADHRDTGRGLGTGLMYVVFFLSGAAALIYEISWSRQIGLLFGHTIQAASVVLGSYFTGLAIGYLLGSRWSLRVSPLKGYAVAELLVAVWAFLIPVLLKFAESPTIAPWFSSDVLAWQTTVRAIFSFLLLLPATIGLGVTLPMMAVYFSRPEPGALADQENVSRVTLAYSLNTFGAVVGVFVATFYMLLNIGVCRSSYVAAALSVVCAVLALWVMKRRGTQNRSSDLQVVGNSIPAASTDSSTVASTVASTNSQSSTLNNGLLWLSALSGFGTLALQVPYTRVFSLVFHNSTYTFGLVIIVFLGALALGAALVARLQKWFRAPRLLGCVTVLGSIACLVSVIVFVDLTDVDYFASGNSFTSYIFGALQLVMVVVGPPITCLGMMLPLIWTLAAGTGTSGQVVGRLTAVNTFAASFGALLTSFVLLQFVGLWASFICIAVLFYLAAFGVLWKCEMKWLAWSAGIVFGVMAFLVVATNSGSSQNAAEDDELLVWRWNSAYGWIDVLESRETGSMKIRQNMHYRFGATRENPREFRQAHLPLLLHDDPQQVLFMGLGTGLTAAGAIPHSEVKKIVVVELIPEVVKAARLLRDFNRGIVDSPRAEVRVDDARHHLLADSRKYDVIVSDLFVPWESQSGYLYTVEHYQVAKQRLNSDGLFCQWIPLYQLGEREFEAIANSFSSVFDNTTLWWGQFNSNKPVVGLIGTKSGSSKKIESLPLNRRLVDLDQRAKGIDPVIDSVKKIWTHYIGDWHPRGTANQGTANLNTDEHPRVEFLTPFSNRNRTLLGGDRFDSYFADKLTRLPCEKFSVDDQQLQSLDRHKTVRLWLMFGPNR